MKGIMQFCEAFLIRALIQFISTETLRPNHFPEALPLNTIVFRFQFQHMHFGGTGTFKPQHNNTM